MLRIVPSSDAELKRVQELQDLEELQVLGAAGCGGEDFPTTTCVPCFAPTEQSRDGCGLEMMSCWGACALFWGAVGDGRGINFVGAQGRGLGSG